MAITNQEHVGEELNLPCTRLVLFLARELESVFSDDAHQQAKSGSPRTIAARGRRPPCRTAHSC